MLNQRPDRLERLPIVLDEIFAELEIVQVEEAHDLATRLHDFLWYLLELWIVLANYEEAGVHDLRQVLLVEVWQLLLAEDRFDDVQD